MRGRAAKDARARPSRLRVLSSRLGSPGYTAAMSRLLQKPHVCCPPFRRLACQRPFYAAHPSTLCLTAGRFDARHHATVKRSVGRALTMMPMGAASDSAFRQIVSAIVSSTGQGIVDAPTRIYLRRRGRSHWGSLIPTAHRIRTATREVAPRRRTDGVVRERYWRLLCRIRGGTGAVGLDGRPQCAN